MCNNNVLKSSESLKVIRFFFTKCANIVVNLIFKVQIRFIGVSFFHVFFLRFFRDLLVDTGVGIFNLPAYLTSAQLRNAPDKPLDVVLTHAHFDHSGGAHQFSNVRTNKKCMKTMSTKTSSIFYG